MLQTLDGGVDAEPNDRADIGEAGKEDEFTSGPEVPGSEGEKEKDGDEDGYGEEVGQLNQPLWRYQLGSV